MYGFGERAGGSPHGTRREETIYQQTERLIFGSTEYLGSMPTEPVPRGTGAAVWVDSLRASVCFLMLFLAFR